MLPDRAGSLALLAEAGCDDEVVRHVEAVARLALALSDHAPGADRRVVEAGALLHDIGRAFDHSPAHVPLGVAFLEACGVAPPVLACVARHLGAGVTSEEARTLGWPPGDHTPQRLEERIVCHADNLTFGTRYASLAEVLAKLERRGLADKQDRMRALHDGLAEELGVDPDEVARSLGS